MADASVNNDVKIEDLGATKKRLTIVVSPEAINEKIDDSMATLAAETSLPGFRPGRAPQKLLERRFGSAVRNETKNQIIAEAYSSAVEDHKIRAAGEPEPAEGTDFENIEIEPGKPLEFAVEVEVIPDFDLPDFSKIEVKRPTLEIAEDLIEKEMEGQRMRNGTPEEVKADFEFRDRLVGNVNVTKKGEDEPFFTHQNADILVPSDENEGRGQVLGLLIDGLAGMIAGKKIGDTLTIDTKGPEQHEREDIRGADITINFEISGGMRIIPCTNEELVEMYGMGTEEVLLEQIKLALEQRRDDESAEAMRGQVNKQLLELVDFPLPERLSANQIERSLQRRRLELLYRGVDEMEVEERLAEMRDESEADALRRLKLFLILESLAEHFDVEVNEHEINGRIAEIAARRGMRPDQVRSELIKGNQLNSIAVQIREQKAADRVAQEGTVTDISAEEWATMLAGENGDADAAPAKKKKTTKKKSGTKKKTTKKKTTKSDD